MRNDDSQLSRPNELTAAKSDFSFAETASNAEFFCSQNHKRQSVTLSVAKKENMTERAEDRVRKRTE